MVSIVYNFVGRYFSDTKQGLFMGLQESRHDGRDEHKVQTPSLYGFPQSSFVLFSTQNESLPKRKQQSVASSSFCPPGKASAGGTSLSPRRPESPKASLKESKETESVKKSFKIGEPFRKTFISKDKKTHPIHCSGLNQLLSSS